MVKPIPPETRQFGWIDFNKREPPIGRAIMIRQQIVESKRPIYAGTWHLPRIVARADTALWFMTGNGISWNIWIGPSYVIPYQWRDIPGTPMRQAIQMAKLAMES